MAEVALRAAQQQKLGAVELGGALTALGLPTQIVETKSAPPLCAVWLDDSWAYADPRGDLALGEHPALSGATFREIPPLGAPETARLRQELAALRAEHEREREAWRAELRRAKERWSALEADLRARAAQDRPSISIASAAAPAAPAPEPVKAEGSRLNVLIGIATAGLSLCLLAVWIDRRSQRARASERREPRRDKSSTK